MLPVIIPTQEELQVIKPLFQRAVEIRKSEYTNAIPSNENKEELCGIENQIDEYVGKLYSVNISD